MIGNVGNASGFVKPVTLPDFAAPTRRHHTRRFLASKLGFVLRTFRSLWYHYNQPPILQPLAAKNCFSKCEPTGFARCILARNRTVHDSTARLI
jgi:hypothetical protein